MKIGYQGARGRWLGGRGQGGAGKPMGTREGKYRISVHTYVCVYWTGGGRGREGGWWAGIWLGGVGGRALFAMQGG